jgi:thymidine phosphorylase
MLAQEIIRRKRDGRRLPAEEIDFLIDGLTRGTVADAQAAAFAMAVFFRGLDGEECAALTRAMTRSGHTLDWSRAGLHGPVLDKHSTGGVGDNVSLILAPAVAACGAHVPMISGRGLGHTGGTLDKLEAIPGYDTHPDEPQFMASVRDVGCAIIGQTRELAPADARLYAIRDVTGSVESIPLITASILSKKLAAGLGGLVMDVKTGSGAFMPAREDARALARSIVDTARRAGLQTRALVTDMDQPLASSAGNALETRHALDVLTGRSHEPRLHEVVVALGAEMLLIGKICAGRDDARARIEQALASGAAAETFARMCAALGGPPDILERYDALLARAPVERPVAAARAGYVAKIDARAIGVAVVELGGGRRRSEDEIDHAVGFSRLAAVGDRVSADHPVGLVHARDDEAAQVAALSLRAAYQVADEAPAVAASAVIERLEI